MTQRPGGAPFMNRLPQSVIDRYEAEHPEQRTAAKEHPTEHVPMEDLPIEGDGQTHPFPISRHDDPNRYVVSGHFEPGTTFSLRQRPLADLADTENCVDGKHQAACYEWKREHGKPWELASCGDNMSEGEPGSSDYYNDADSVRKMAQTPHALPALVATDDGEMFGGGHRTAAWREAGWTHAPIWVPDPR